MNLNKFWLRVAGISGISGALILFAGDMLFYYGPSSIDLRANMGHVSDLRIKLSGVAALFASWFYLFGLIQVYYAFKTSSAKARNIVIICFAAILTAYGVIHGAYVAIAVSSKLSVQHNIDIDTATALSLEVNNLMRLFIYPIFAVLSFVFIKEVWKGNTLYPRKIIFFFPLIPFLFHEPLKRILSGGARIIIAGGFFNLILLIFFVASTVILWNNNPNSE
ncbi:MAG: hypothetical protein GXO50_09425 [Chlorobi bacterium]|nr:hypothetical protein [Chlorobiota bacterium]